MGRSEQPRRYSRPQVQRSRNLRWLQCYNVENAAFLMIKEYVLDDEGNRAYFQGRYFEPLINTERLIEELEASPLSVEA